MDSGGISAIIFAILFVVVTAFSIRRAYIAGDFTGDASPDLSFFSLLILYLPNTLLAYGFIADITNMTYHYSIASMTALSGMIINRYIGGVIVDAIMSVVSLVGTQFGKLPLLVQAAVGVGAAAGVGVAAAASAPLVAAAPAAPAVATGLAAINPFAAAVAAAPGVAAASTPKNTDGPIDEGLMSLGSGGRRQRGGATDLCSLPGFEWLDNKTAPQGIVMSMTILWYLMIELWDTGRGSQSAALGITTLVVFVLQSLVLTNNGCLTSYKYGISSILIALIMSIVFAGSSYGIQKGFSKYSGNARVPPVPSGTPGNFVCPPGTTSSLDRQSCQPILGPGGNQPSGLGNTQTINVGGVGEKTEPVDDQDQFVCEAYKNGELITSTIVE
jgi:hypothetical protein